VVNVAMDLELLHCTVSSNNVRFSDSILFIGNEISSSHVYPPCLPGWILLILQSNILHHVRNTMKGLWEDILIPENAMFFFLLLDRKR
jgi:hypothetical protein